MSYYLHSLQRGIDYIESRLDEEVELSLVARAAGISQWHFQRIFKSLTGETLKTYIRSRRLAGSLDRLLSTRLRVLDIALLAGFESQEAFARAFKKAFGLTPQAYRKIGSKSLFLKKPQFDRGYLEHVGKNVSLEPEIELVPRKRMVGVQTHFFGPESEKNNFGAQLPPLWAGFLPRVAEIPHRIDGTGYGVVKQEREDSERLEYHAAYEVSEAPHPEELPPGMVFFEVPAARYARFAHRGLATRIDHTVSYAYATWLLQSGMQHTYGPDLEIYGEGYHPTSPDSVFHYAIPVEERG